MHSYDLYIILIQFIINLYYSLMRLQKKRHFEDVNCSKWRLINIHP